MKRALIITGVVVGLVVVVVALSFSGIWRREVTADEKELLITIADIAPYVPDTTFEGDGDFIAKRNLDGSWELEYRFEGGGISLDSEAEIYRTTREAKQGFRDRISAYAIGVKIGGGDTRLVPKEKLLDVGESNHVAMMQRGYVKLGNVVVLQKHNMVLSLLLTGLYFDDRDDLNTLFQPKVAQIEKMKTGE